MSYSEDCNYTRHEHCESPAECECGCHERRREPSGHEPGGFATVEAWRRAQAERDAFARPVRNPGSPAHDTESIARGNW